MNFQDAILHHIHHATGQQAWPELTHVLERAATQPQRDWAVPQTICLAMGGSEANALAASAALACAQISIVLIDDLLDADPRGVHQQWGMPATANLAAALQALSAQLILESELPPAFQAAATYTLNKMLAQVAYGQYLDALGIKEEAHYWKVAALKSGAFFGAAWELGALLGRAEPETAQHLHTIGALYGEMVQIHDDLNDSLATPANPDWLLGRATLPLLFAEAVNHPARERFQQVRPHVTQPEALAEAQEILIHCGAISYGLHALTEREAVAREKLNALKTTGSAWVALEKMLDELIEPVHALLSEPAS